jgi:hypothetical protein
MEKEESQLHQSKEAAARLLCQHGRQGGKLGNK